MWMIESLHELDLSSDRFLALDLLHLLLEVNLESDLLVRLFVHAYVNDSIGTLTDLFPDYIVVQGGLGRKDDHLILLLCNLLLSCYLILVIHWDDILGNAGNPSSCVARGGLLWARNDIPHGF
jgi:hypothetical protein